MIYKRLLLKTYFIMQPTTAKKGIHLCPQLFRKVKTSNHSLDLRLFIKFVSLSVVHLYLNKFLTSLFQHRIYLKLRFLHLEHMTSDGLTKRGARCKKKRGHHFLAFRNKVISKKGYHL